MLTWQGGLTSSRQQRFNTIWQSLSNTLPWGHALLVTSTGWHKGCSLNIDSTECMPTNHMQGHPTSPYNVTPCLHHHDACYRTPRVMKHHTWQHSQLSSPGKLFCTPSFTQKRSTKKPGYASQQPACTNTACNIRLQTKPQNVHCMLRGGSCGGAPSTHAKSR